MNKILLCLFQFNKKPFRYFLTGLILILSVSCNPVEMETVDSVELNRYMGTWYEIASLPTTFNKGCNCSKVDMELEPNRKYVRIINSCVKKEKQGAVLSKAYIQNEPGCSKWKVQMFWPFKTDYYILSLDEKYTYTMVGNPDLSQLQIFSRTREMNQGIYDELISRAAMLGFDTSMISKTSQVCN